MKINKTLCKIILLVMSILICGATVCYASDLPDVDKFGPGPIEMGGTATNIIATILSVMRVLGVIALVVGLTLIGFNSILGSANEKAEGQGKYVGLVIAAALLIGGSTIAKMIISVAEGF